MENSRREGLIPVLFSLTAVLLMVGCFLHSNVSVAADSGNESRTRMVFSFEMPAYMAEENETMEHVQECTIDRIKRRITALETEDVIVRKLGANQIEVLLPKGCDTDRINRLLHATANLTFHVVADLSEMTKALSVVAKDPRFEGRLIPFMLPPEKLRSTYVIPNEFIDKTIRVIDEINETNGLLPEGKLLALSPPPNSWDVQAYYVYLIGKEPLMTGAGLARAVAIPDENNPPKWMILFEFNKDAAVEFGNITEANISKTMAIVVDGTVYSAPTIQSRITRRGQISGNFSEEQAADLAIALNSGALPVPLKLDECSKVPAAATK